MPAGDSFEAAVEYRVTQDLYDEYAQVIGDWTAKAVAYVNGAPVAEEVLGDLEEF